MRLEKITKWSELGKMVGLTYTAISDIERGRRVTTMEKLDALADYFGMSVDYLMGKTDNPGVNRNWRFCS